MHKIHRRFIMKRIFALILVVLMLVPFVASCTEPRDTDTNSTPPASDTSTDTSKDTSTDTDDGNKPVDPNKKDVDEAMKDYEGEIINIMAPTWTNGEAGYPWSQVELCVTDWDKNANGFGTKINNGVMERQEYIENTYGVTLNWINCQGASMLNKLTEAVENKGTQAEEIIHVALPHVFEAMELVNQEALYTLGSDYINFDADYFNQESIENYTLAGNTFFAAGDISFLDELTAFVLFYNNAIAEEFGDSFPDLYEAVLNGTWTIDMLYDLAGEISYNADNKDGYSDDDKYGLGTTQLAKYYQYFGVYQVGKGTDSGNNEVFVLTIENDKVQTIIDKMLFATKNEDAIRTKWDGGYGAMEGAFKDNRLLFYHEVMQKVHSFDNELKVGVLPFPKLTTDQDRYYVAPAQQATIVCVPRATNDRVLSECMVEILSKTAGEFIMPTFIDTIADSLHVDYLENSLEVINKQIFPNLMYDLGAMYGRFGGDGDGLITESVQNASIDGNTNNFTLALSQGRTQAETKLSEWSLAYNMYQD